MDEIRTVLGNAVMFAIGIALGLLAAELIYLLIPHIQCWLVGLR